MYDKKTLEIVVDGGVGFAQGQEESQESSCLAVANVLYNLVKQMKRMRDGGVSV